MKWLIMLGVIWTLSVNFSYAQENIPLFSSFNGMEKSTNTGNQVYAAVGQNIIGRSTGGHTVYLGMLSYQTTIYTGTREQKSLGSLESFVAYPNPFAKQTTIDFSLLKSGHVQLEIMNVLGQKIHYIINQELDMGSHTYHFDGSDLMDGVYYCRVKIDGLFVTTFPLLLARY